MRIRGREGITPEISQVSMSDVAFLLLIFFLSTTIFDDEIGLPLVLPELAARPSAVTRAEVLTVHLDAAGRVSIDGVPALLEEVASILTARVEREPEVLVVVTTAGETRYGRLVDLLDEVRQSGARRLSLQPGGA
jgi:biopolymer transport protein ExbD